MVDLEKHFLRYVFRLWNKLPAEDRQCKSKHAITMAANQFRKGLLVAALHASHELGVVLHQRQRRGSPFR